MSSNSLDTNLLVRFILGDIPKQRRLVAELLATQGTTHHLADLAITETVYVLETVYQQTRAEIVDELQAFFNRYTNCLSYSKNLFAAVFPFYLEHPKLAFNDCCLAAYAEQSHAEPLFTFDKKLALQSPSAKELK